MNEGRIKLLSGNVLKIIAALTMLVDHIGLLLFPGMRILRIVGRLSFPIFAFMIAEGAEYTKNKKKYFLGIFVLAVICQVAYYIFDNSTYMCILVTFSLSIITIYALQNVKGELFSKEKNVVRQGVAVLIFVLTVAVVYMLNGYFSIDYGFWGCMTPVFASVLRSTKKDSVAANVLLMGICLMILSVVFGGVQVYLLLSIPLLLLYSGKRGKWKMKSFFYIFYPLHLVVLQGIYMLMYGLY